MTQGSDYLFYVDGKAAGIIEAKKEGSTLTGVEVQSDKYKNGLPDILPAWHRPLPFCYESTGLETRFTSYLDTDARSRQVFSFHRPETFHEWLTYSGEVSLDKAAESSGIYWPPSTLRSRLRKMPQLIEDLPVRGAQAGWLWPAQIRALTNLEKSMAQNRPRAVVQMATGSGKTFTAVTFIYRLLRFAGAKR